MAEQATFKIGETEYEFPSRFRMGDPVLVEELTGISFTAFSERIEVSRDDERADMVVMVGLIGVAIWQANPRWKRDRVVAFVNDIDLEQFEAFAADAVPPTLGVQDDPASLSGDSSSESTSIPEPSPAEVLG